MNPHGQKPPEFTPEVKTPQIYPLDQKSPKWPPVVKDPIPQQLGEKAHLRIAWSVGDFMLLFARWQPTTWRGAVRRLYRDLEISVRGHSRSLKMVPTECLDMVSCSHSIITTALCCTISEIKRNIGRKSRYFIPPAFDAPLDRSPSVS